MLSEKKRQSKKKHTVTVNLEVVFADRLPLLTNQLQQDLSGASMAEVLVPSLCQKKTLFFMQCDSDLCTAYGLLRHTYFKKRLTGCLSGHGFRMCLYLPVEAVIFGFLLLVYSKQ